MLLVVMILTWRFKLSMAEVKVNHHVINLCASLQSVSA